MKVKRALLFDIKGFAIWYIFDIHFVNRSKIESEKSLATWYICIACIGRQRTTRPKGKYNIYMEYVWLEYIWSILNCINAMKDFWLKIYFCLSLKAWPSCNRGIWPGRRVGWFIMHFKRRVHKNRKQNLSTVDTNGI